MKVLKLMSNIFAKDMTSPKKKVTITARLCDLMCGGSRSSSSCTVDPTVVEEVLHGAIVFYN
jgi:hypothetical protein